MRSIALGAAEHGSAATPGSATAGVFAEGLRCRCNLEGVVDEEFFAGRNVAGRLDVDTAAFLNRFAVRRAGMVEPSRAVPAAATVNHPSVGQAEQEGMALLIASRVVTRCFPPGGHEPPVFEHALTTGKRAKGEHALPVDGRSPDGNAFHAGQMDGGRPGV